ncbi:uncharacterized protein LOC107037198 [Diachasma alloeum]|uniref:uncharacterized protein LOC107037198 n=1 Tax=Diachasma alloeum TaxID=454923 RepID=UPI0007382E08|nr:uncharacterized protein LOC107037198 [Diachasma alloeum]
MTRKCVLCKETNYKNSYSFFSAPKDQETRKKWQEAIAIENYTVSDDTYVCSRHFLPSDIITHWVSGVPPHVVTIKYKKCRLRPGAIPTTSCEAMNNMQNNQEDDLEDFEVNRNWGNSDRRPATFADEKKEFFLIPRDDKIITYNCNENQSLLKSNIGEDDAEIEDYSSTEVGESLQDQVVDMIMNNEEQDQVLEVMHEDLEESGNTIYLKTSDDPQIVYIEDSNCRTDCIEEEIEETNTKDRIDGFSPQKFEGSGEEGEESIDMWESVDGEKESAQEVDQKNSREVEEDAVMDTEDPLDLNQRPEDLEDAMLFEDLLDVYTEVPLPRGWSSVVISKGRGTTVIYAFMTMTKSGVPYAEKQVFLMSDMVVRCSAAGREINPRLYNLLREGKQLKVQSLMDVEDIIEEFDQRIVCEGSSEKINTEDIDNTVGFRDGFKWRHMSCSILINNGTSRCSKCSALNVSANRRKLKKPPQTAESAELLKKDRTIFVLQKLLAKMSKKNQRIETVKDNLEGKLKQRCAHPQKNLISCLESLNIPKIQKIMMTECLKSSSQEKTSNFSETWTFLSLLLYIESPRTYKYLLINKFMNLPPIKLMRRYLHQIKTDTQFYKLFQRSVEPFNVSEMADETEPT